MDVAKILIPTACALFSAAPGRGQVNVWTYHNDNARTGANLSETQLTLANVNYNSFGLLFSCQVESFPPATSGQIYAQPLVLTGVTLPDGSVRNLVFAATESDAVYAFDADGPGCVRIWKRDFTDSDNFITPVPATITGSSDITPWLGITGTPVIDVDTGTLYAVSKTKEVRVSTGECATDTCDHYVQTLYALDVATGVDKFGSPAIIADTVYPTGLPGDRAYGHVVGACVAGTGDGSVDGQVCFNALRSHMRDALALSSGVLYLAWSSHSDRRPYQGWVIGYDPVSLQQIPGAVFNTAPNGAKGGIWGGALSFDGDGNIFFSTGDGIVSDLPNGDTVVKLSVFPDGSLNMADLFTPWNQRSLSMTDRDLSSGGVLILPDQGNPTRHLLLTAGKENKIYLIDRDDMGGYQRCGPQCDDVLATHPMAIVNGETNGIPAYLNTGFEQVVFYAPGQYQGSRNDLKRFAFTVDPPSIVQVAEADPPTEYPIKGAIPSLSGHWTETGYADVILWTLEENSPEAGVPAVLHAHDALATPMTEIYTSRDAPESRDRMGNSLKFTLPTVANGKVYAGTATRLDVFGLLPK